LEAHKVTRHAGESSGVASKCLVLIIIQTLWPVIVTYVNPIKYVLVLVCVSFQVTRIQSNCPLQSAAFGGPFWTWCPPRGVNRIRRSSMAIEVSDGCLWAIKHAM